MNKEHEVAPGVKITDEQTRTLLRMKSEPVAAEPVAWLFSFHRPGRATQYASVDEKEWRDGISQEEWRTRVVVPLYTHPKEQVNKKMLKALRGLLARHEGGSDEWHWAEWDIAKLAIAAAAEAQPDMDIDDVAKAPPQKVEAVIKGAPAAQPALPTQQQIDEIMRLADRYANAFNQHDKAGARAALHAALAALPREKQP